MRDLNIIIIGLGGVGSILSERLCRFLNYANEFKVDMKLVDGDNYELKNYERQEFDRIGNKAEIKADELEMKFSSLAFDVFTSYVNETNINNVIKEGDIVFLCVDNHKSRMIVNNYCKNLKDVTLISGGNELTDGNVQLFIRKGGKDLTPDLCAYHPEIATPDDKLPDEMSCEELAQSEPQLYFTNLGVATFMCWMFYNCIVKEQYEKSEVYFDITQMTSDAKIRIVK
ncbi:MAG: ThiF family adenylyltransferase [Candidatus Thorarchaeota archaeon]